MNSLFDDIVVSTMTHTEEDTTMLIHAVFAIALTLIGVIARDDLEASFHQ